VRTSVQAVIVAASALIALVACSSHSPSTPARSTARPSDTSSSSTASGTPSQNQSNARVGALNPSVFASGSCMALAPTSGNRHVTVFLDPGHGGPDPGGLGITMDGRHINERELTLPVAVNTANLLRSHGFRVVLSRTTDGPVAQPQPGDVSSETFTIQGQHRDLVARPLCANVAGASVLVSVHFNVGGSPNNAGTMTTYDAVRPFSARNAQLANLLQRAMVTALHSQPDWNTPDNGVVTDEGVGNALTAQGHAYGHLDVLGPPSPGYVDTPSAMPGALIEPLFLTDPFEGSIAASVHGQQVMASALAQGIEQFLQGP
jgi:N-acetylmuramoyl-L-alanine amidase